MKPGQQRFQIPVANLLSLRILDALPQTQCTRCGYADCAGYAEAIADGQAGINQCPPGGAEGINRLAAITGLPVETLNPIHGNEGPRSMAVIDEAWCIGCTLCLKVCPTDAIVGSNKWMHTVIEPHCTGCGLCLPVCPVDCISLENTTGTATGWNAWSESQADSARKRYDFHSCSCTNSLVKSPKRLENEAYLKDFEGPASLVEAPSTPTTHASPTATSPDPRTEAKRLLIAAAIARASEIRAQPSLAAKPG